MRASACLLLALEMLYKYQGVRTVCTSMEQVRGQGQNNKLLTGLKAVLGFTGWID